MQRDNVYLLDILEAARLAREYVGAFKRQEFTSNTQVQDSAIYSIFKTNFPRPSKRR